MDFTFDTILNIISLIGGGGLGALFYWRYTRRKAKAEAEEAETTAAKEMQDVYQQLIADVKADRDEQKAYIAELKEDRHHLRSERDELRQRIDQTDEKVRDLQAQVARNGRIVESLRPFLCGFLGCTNRTPVTISADGEAKPKRPKKEKEITPYNKDDQP